MPNPVESGGESLVSVWYMAEIAFDPFGCRGMLNVKESELLSVMCSGLYRSREAPRHVMTRAGLLCDLCLHMHCISVVLLIKERNV